MLLNEGKQYYVNRADSDSTQNDMSQAYILWSNGTADPALTDQRSDFTSDGTGGSKIIATHEYESANQRHKITASLTTAEGNSPGSITKIGLVSDVSAGLLINENKFTARTKDTTKEINFTVYINFKDSSEV